MYATDLCLSSWLLHQRPAKREEHPPGTQPGEGAHTPIKLVREQYWLLGWCDVLGNDKRFTTGIQKSNHPGVSIADVHNNVKQTLSAERSLLTMYGGEEILVRSTDHFR